MRGRKGLLTCLKIVTSGGLLLFLYHKTPLTELQQLFVNIDFRFFPLIIVLLFINTVLSALKWQILLRCDSVHLPLLSLTVTYLIGSFYNLFLPSNIGGDSYRIYDVARQSNQTVRSAASVFADRFSGFLALVILGLLSSIIVAVRIGNPLFFIGPLVIFCLLVIILLALYKQTPIRFFLALTRLDRIEMVTRVVEKFFLSFEKYGANRRVLGQVMLISFCFQFSVICVVYFLALSLHASVSFFYFSAFVPLITLMEALPISIYGLGIRDVGYVWFFGWAGLSDIQTRSLALLFLGVTVCYSLVGGGIYFWRTFISAKFPSGSNVEKNTTSDG